MIKKLKRIIKDESGQAFVTALIVMCLASLLIGAFLNYIGTGLIATQTTEKLAAAQYTADAGIEDAIWNILYGDFTETVLLKSGDSISYSLPEAINGTSPDITVTRLHSSIAGDNFESGDWAGGHGWEGDWISEGAVQITASNFPYEGTYHMMLRRATGHAMRAVNLQGEENVHLQFRAKAFSFESGETAECLVSSDGNNWTTVRTWEDGDDDNIYRFYDIDISPYEMSSQFWIAFQANMSGGGDYLFIDDLEVTTGSSVAETLPGDDFESGDFSGGMGWLFSWVVQDKTQITSSSDLLQWLFPWVTWGRVDITASGNPYEGDYHLRMRGTGVSAGRAADLSGRSGLRLEFWAKADFQKTGDEAYCRISPDGINWTTVRTWDSNDSDNNYHFNDIDLSSYEMSSEFWIEFSSGMDSNSDYLYIDNLEITGGNGTGISPDATAYQIESIASGKKITAYILVDDTEVAILAWQYE